MDIVKAFFFFSLSEMYFLLNYCPIPELELLWGKIKNKEINKKPQSNSGLIVEGKQRSFVSTPVLVCPTHTSSLIDFNWLYKKKRIWYLILMAYPLGKMQNQCKLVQLCWQVNIHFLQTLALGQEYLWLILLSTSSPIFCLKLTQSWAIFPLSHPPVLPSNHAFKTATTDKTDAAV